MTAISRVGAVPSRLGSLPARTVRGTYEPLRGLIETVGAMVLLARRTIVASIAPPYNYGPELVDQFLFALRLGWFPMIVASLAFTYGPAGIEVGDFLKLVGAMDRLGPLFLSLMLLTPLFTIYALLFGVLGGVFVTISNGAQVGPFFTDFFAQATTVEFQAMFVKAVIYGGVIAIVCCYMGLTASGGAEGVGRAVNRAVVLAFIAIGSIDYVFTQTLLATHPV